MLQPFACQPDASRGRLWPERLSSFRSPFQRDRDRIIHSSAFRRLKHKTQVFVEHEGDYYRTRLTHTIEVAQVARTIAGVLGLNTDLAEAVALAHDLGHTPFGHTGEDAMERLMAPYGGFDHNAQALRIVTRLGMFLSSVIFPLPKGTLLFDILRTLNPAAVLIENARSFAVSGVALDSPVFLAIYLLASIGIFLVGWYVVHVTLPIVGDQ